MKHPNEHYILTVRCADQSGIVAAVATALSSQKVFITESSHYGDPDTGLFFMRTVFRAEDEGFAGMDAVHAALQAVAGRFGMTIQITPESHAMRTIIAVSKHGHCLNNLLHQWHSGELPINVVAVVSNHEEMRRLVEWYGIPYVHLPLEGGDKRAQEMRMLETIREYKAELTVLARYMQILSDDLCRALKGRCINIHHSFLPSFKGARPYHQAHARGVKVIGATAHYVTPDLDEGPIIEQETVRVDHGLAPDEFVRIGKDIENVVLSRAVRWHAQRRVLLNGERTVVFRQAG
ncbi:formyltetrahydrofolate deformylase [Noviherbaspirillum sp.]|jgi:formyltetrahydrofolate deformylase|uniref:formyltetrahydrofolate deformylase n=1 Tax=Noviherbaspirillum sp. TaxID=1926288 RepID=UPI0025CFF547|nr:formyltetrahydrofolate deformylase [Noviherbaspirillum sp.]